MGVDPARPHGFAVEGEVVEILEHRGERHAKVLLKAGTVLDLTGAGVADVHLGDRVACEGSFTIHGVRTRTDDRHARPVVPDRSNQSGR
jgi:hypothetical protein